MAQQRQQVGCCWVCHRWLMFSQQWDPGNCRECLQWLTQPQGFPDLQPHLASLFFLTYTPVYHLLSDHTPESPMSSTLLLHHWAGLQVTHPFPSDCHLSQSPTSWEPWLLCSQLSNSPWALAQSIFSCQFLRFLTCKMNLRLAANSFLLCGAVNYVFKELGACQTKGRCFSLSYPLPALLMAKSCFALLTVYHAVKALDYHSKSPEVCEPR